MGFLCAAHRGAADQSWIAVATQLAEDETIPAVCGFVDLGFGAVALMSATRGRRLVCAAARCDKARAPSAPSIMPRRWRGIIGLPLVVQQRTDLRHSSE
jgi:hypothetical protein